ncbi:glycerophosphoryl diester phosphodiesterase membrane domain-containing protein [Microbacterium sp. zg.Y1090]|uniref:glycerophosphoryl diester phosphodiesterase membrane domain-containing protein n=1 Tax=Microbacterium wangruii TaxID=3049073 RepID=UPI00214CDD84|nr:MULTISPECIES: glycerophosphoryl diester phosphodiesterase membrane domain-containing protein [unclassified Microbacterium]MCR2818102.1 glycerophosphoryl diester phosphodiesterase membrane domain-containing protein [Microbacterium sp. zg.Y1090]WIM27742.1 glycerophosphoryl diester phosphodiesterase membrane domain-containing protein [Microbacterium sp. zg-Y1090]
MTAYPAWTPVTRPGIIPLRPLTFGLVLGRSFSALRQNPRVLLGFAVLVQSVATFLGTTVIVAVSVPAFLRLDTLRPGTPAFDQVLAGSVAMVLAASVLIGLALSALSVLVQGVVVSEVAHAVVAEKLTLRVLWARVKPVAWRLVGYTLLLSLATLVVLGAVVAAVVALVFADVLSGVLLGVGLGLAAIPLVLWLTVKLLLVAPTIILEHATIRGALARSWSLTRGRFWPMLGVVVIISMAFATLGQLVSVPFSLATTAVSTVLTPTGDPETSGFVLLIVGGLLTQAVTVLIQAVSLIVQSTATSLLYIDARMRREGLDQDLLAYVERRDAGVADLPDPYRLHVGRVIAPTPAYAYGYAPSPGYPGSPAYPPYAPYPPAPPAGAAPGWPTGAPAPTGPTGAPAPGVAAPPEGWTAPDGSAPPAEGTAPWARP